MPVTDTVATLSNAAIAACIALYALAMLLFAASAARRGVGGDQPSLAAVRVGAVDDVEPRQRPLGSDVSRAGADFLGSFGISLTLLAAVLHVTGLALRGVAAGRSPWGNMYEFVVAASLAATLAFLVLARRRLVRDLGVWLVGLVVLALGLAVTVL